MKAVIIQSSTLVRFHVCQSYSFIFFWRILSQLKERASLPTVVWFSVLITKWDGLLLPYELVSSLLHPPAFPQHYNILSMVHLHCQLNEMENHHGNTLLGGFMGVFPKKPCLMEKPHYNYEEYHPMCWDPGLTIKRESLLSTSTHPSVLSDGCNVSSSLLLQPFCLLNYGGLYTLKLWAMTNLPSLGCFC